ncbi:MAG TPA: hypothetical protein VFY95_05145 [Sphingomicrobium sp.]
MSSAPPADELWRDARWLVQALDPKAGLVRLVQMTPQAYAQASFLDDRMFQQPRTSRLVPWDAVADTMPQRARADARWIFHIGHVGSTLVARLLGELEGVLSIREPRALRDLTFFPAEVRERFVPVLPALLSRTFGPSQTALVKATSMVSELAGEIVPAGERALFMYTEPRSYIAGILAGENSRKELAGMSELRRQRLARRDIEFGTPRHEADLAAAAWACEMTTLEGVEPASRQFLWMDFDGMLEDMERALADTARFFGFQATDAQLIEIASGPLMRRYSKALDHDYSPALRRDLLAQAEREHGASIREALVMLEDAAQESPLLTRAMARTNPEA